MSARERPNRRRAALPIAVSLILILACPACDDAGKGSSVDPGIGVHSNGVSIRIGELRSDTAGRLGQPSSARNLGSIGVLLSYPDRHLSLLVSGEGDAAPVTAIYLATGFEGRTPGGSGIGSSHADVTAEFQAAAIDPFLGTWRYAAIGIAFDWDGNAAGSITVSSPGI